MKRTESKAEKEARSGSTRPRESRREPSGSNARAAPVVRLHGAIGNQAVKALAETEGCGRAPVERDHYEGEEAGPTTKRFVNEALIRPKLDVSSPTDGHEREAERVADAVSRNTIPESFDGISGTSTGRGIPTGKRKPDQQFGSVRGSGRPLPRSARAFFEPLFGRDFSDVRVHTGPNADEAARSINAEAFTHGQDVVFRNSKYRPEVRKGKELLAHELTHAVQQRSASTIYRKTPESSNEEQTGNDNSTTEEDEKQAWLPELNEVLPSEVGLVTHINRTTMLVDIFGSELLEQHVRLIHADDAATRFTRNYGVPGIVALYDTRRDDQIDVAAAKQALDEFSDRYRRESLEKMNLRQRQEAPPSVWFQERDREQRESAEDGPSIETVSERQSQVYVESELSEVGENIFVRFAYPRTGTESEIIQNAKIDILQAISRLVGKLRSVPEASSEAQRRGQLEERARLKEPLRVLSSSSPLNVFIDTDPTEEMRSGRVAATTEQIYVDRGDLGDPDKLEAAIRVPIVMLTGGMVPTRGGPQKIDEATEQELERTRGVTRPVDPPIQRREHGLGRK